MESGDGSTQTLTPTSLATSPLRLLGYAAILIAAAFSQRGSDLVADTKFDLVTNPLGFLSRGVHLWDPIAAFGQIQNQAYGYLWPMGPFFLAGKLIHLPSWAVQRSWWALLLCVGFFGVLRLAQRLGLGTPLTQVVAAFAYVLAPRVTSLLGSTSVEVWPMAVAPWVLLPLMWGTAGGSLRKAAALSALAVACAGGVNAVAVVAVLPLGVLWLLTREAGPRRWQLLALWTAFTILATAWWWAPLLLMGKYSVPFLDYIENATITTLPTGLTHTLLGVSDWVAYFATADYPAGSLIVSTAFLLVAAATLAAGGLLGIGASDNPHRRFLVLGVLCGVALVGFGYAGDWSGFGAEARRAALDGSLAPLRNLHKFDVVLRIPLVLGFAHALAVVPKRLEEGGSLLAKRMLWADAVLMLVALSFPWVNGVIAPGPGVSSVPGYWKQAASYLAETNDGTVSLELPASSFGVYIWGNVHDDVMQGLARSPWAVRNAIPLAQPGNVAMLDAVTRVIESGHPDPGLANFLASNGVGRLVVRNDLDRLATGAPDPGYVRSVLTRTPGITKEAGFGPISGEPSYRYIEADGGSLRLTAANTMASEGEVIEVYRVDGAATASITTDPKTIIGDPAARLSPDVAALTGPSVLATTSTAEAAGQVLTDGLKRREVNFASVRWNQSSTMSADRDYLLSGKEHFHRISPDDPTWQTTQSWVGDVDRVWSSSSQADANALPPLDVGTNPAAALDADAGTSWQSARQSAGTGQWWEVRFSAPRTLTSVTLSVPTTSLRMRLLEFKSGRVAVTRPAPLPGSSQKYDLPFTNARSLRISVVGKTTPEAGSVAFSEVLIDGIAPQRMLVLPRPVPGRPVDEIALQRDADRLGCVDIEGNLACQRLLATQGEDGDSLNRRFYIPGNTTYIASARASLRSTPAAWRAILADAALRVTASRGASDSFEAQPGAMVDGDPGTTWIASDKAPVISLRFDQPRRIDSLEFALNNAAPASSLRVVRLVADGGRDRRVTIPEDGLIRLPGWQTQSLRIEVSGVVRSLRTDNQTFKINPAGVSEIKINGASPTPPGDLSLTCGQGPQLQIAGRTVATSMVADRAALMRGASVPLTICGDSEISMSGLTDVVAPPSAALRVDSVTLVRDGAAAAQVAPLVVRRDATGAPRSVQVVADLGATQAQRLLALPQNANAGWAATLQGKRLTSVTVDGWKQGWWVPADAAGTITFSYLPATSLTIALLLGLLGALLVLIAAVAPDPRRAAPLLSHPRPSGWVHAALVMGVLAVLGGWLGVGLGVAALLAFTRARGFAGWGALSGVGLLAATAAVAWGPVRDADSAALWGQAWALAALSLVGVAALADCYGRFPISVRRTHTPDESVDESVETVSDS